MLELSKSEFINLIKEIGPNGWQLYSVLRLEAVNDKVCLKQEEMADMIGVSSTRTVYSRINKLAEVKIGGQALVELIEKRQECNVYRISSMEVSKIVQVSKNLLDTSIINTSKDLKDIKELETSKKLLTPKEAIGEWCRLYTERYGVNYAVSWGRDTKLMKKLLDIYGEERLMAIFDVVLRLYETKWQSKGYIRPTLGQLSSWLAVQAEAYASANLKETKETEEPTIITEDGTDLMDEWARKGWV